MSTTREITLPDIGDFDQVEIIEIAVGAGDTIAAEDTLLTLESDKATMDVPAPCGGVIRSLLVQVGDAVSTGTPIAVVETDDGAEETVAEPPPEQPARAPDADIVATRPVPDTVPEQPSSGPPSVVPGAVQAVGKGTSSRAHASPSVRYFARQLGVDLSLVRGTGRRGRIVREDVEAFVRGALCADQSARTAGSAVPYVATVDFSKYGPVESKPLGRIKRLTAINLHRSWSVVPHVTQFDEADITELEAFRKSHLSDAEQQGVKLTLLSFLVKVVSDALRQYPDFNASLNPDATVVIHKQYCHIGIAVNTERGLIVPVIHDADKRGLFDIAREIARLSGLARAGRVIPRDLQGGCFTISSLGGVGGSHFSPIINTPEVGILGVSRAIVRPIYRDGQLVPRLILPFALSYDHRLIDGVAGAQFTRFLSTALSDLHTGIAL